ncbi:Ankyrin repeat-containing protein [Carex littledalei]|uniref:Ankyrin repeat-containing protein n=1 Tax=Carex littledalei TaxID=544730 RepID=A0A833VWX2_9POAL|nr:Ankyrin repeat-containing protein [Carex littledalei]
MSNSASLASSSCPSDTLMDKQLLKACTKGDFSLCTHLILANPDILLSTTPYSNNCLHIAAMLGHEKFAKEIWSKAPSLFSGTNIDGETPLIAALMAANLSLASDIITAASQYMQHDDLEEGRPLNRMLLKVDRRGENALHHAMRNGFENLALQLLDIEPQLSEQVSNTGESPMYMAARRGYSRVVERLLQIPSSADSGPKDESALHAATKFGHAGQDYSALTVNNETALSIVSAQTALIKTLKWNESFTLLSNTIPSGWKHIVGDKAKKTIKKQAIEEVKSLTAKYTSNTSLVAALLATVTFAAAFTLPGGFSADPADAGLPIFAGKAAFKVFIFFDTIAMCSSLAVAFLCILATWEDLDFLLNYRKTTRALMWCAYGATAVAFGTGLFTVIAPNNLWLAILILVLCTILPLLSKIIGEWPLLMLRYRLRGLFRKDLIPNI